MRQSSSAYDRRPVHVRKLDVDTVVLLLAEESAHESGLLPRVFAGIHAGRGHGREAVEPAGHDVPGIVFREKRPNWCVMCYAASSLMLASTPLFAAELLVYVHASTW